MESSNREQSMNILELLQTGSAAIDYISCEYSSGGIQEAAYLFGDISELIVSVQRGVESLDYQLPLTRFPEIIKNLISHIDNVHSSITVNNIESIDYELRLLLPALYQLLRNEVAFLVEDFVDKDEFSEFYPESLPVNKEEVISEMKESKSFVSLVLLAYNKLEYTKKCVESILEYTRDCDYELILVNNGSTDGTEEYFDSFPFAKRINLKYNVGATLGFNIGMMVAEGKYVAALCNDFIFTHNWLSNLIKCIKSDETFGYVAPAATYMSNYQQVDVKFNRIEEFHEFAKEYNVSDPLKWEERIVLLPTVLFIPTPLIKRINFYDTRYYYGEFADDDISFKVRRAGFKCIFCKDTVLHHFGSVTVGIDQRENKSLEVSRLIFKEKYGLDAWNDARFDLNLVNMTDFNTEIKNILGIDVKCGGTPLHVKNVFRNKGQDSVAMSLFTTDEKYFTDLETITDNVTFDENIHNLTKYYQAEQFDLILIEEPINDYDEISLKKMLTVVKMILKPGGQVLLKINNPSYFHNIYSLLLGTTIYKRGSKVYTTSHINQSASELGFSTLNYTSVIDSNVSLFSNKLTELMQDSGNQGDTKQILLTKEILYRIS